MVKALLTPVVFMVTAGLTMAEGKFQTAILIDGMAVVQTNTETGEIRICSPGAQFIMDPSTILDFLDLQMQCGPWRAHSK